MGYPSEEYYSSCGVSDKRDYEEKGHLAECVVPQCEYCAAINAR